MWEEDSTTHSEPETVNVVVFDGIRKGPIRAILLHLGGECVTKRWICKVLEVGCIDTVVVFHARS